MSKKNRKAWRASVQRQQNETTEPKEVAPHELRGLARQEWIDAKAKEMFQAEMGHDIDQLIRSLQLTTTAFESQMLESKGGPEGWGPDISVYENRMNQGLAVRLLREKRSWLRDCRQRIEKALADEAAFEAEQADEEGNEETPAQNAPDESEEVVTTSAPNSSQSERTAGTQSVARNQGHQVPNATPALAHAT